MPGQKNLDVFAHEYLAPPPDRSVDQKFFEMISDFVVSRLDGDQILELGVGDQVWTPKLVKKFSSVTSLDASKELLRAMKEKLGSSNWTPVETYFEEYAPANRFDIVLATYVLEHVDDVAAILNRARDCWLKPNGKLAIVVPHALSLHRRLAVTMGLASHPAELGESDRRIGHQRCLTHVEMAELLADTGFEIVEQKGMITKVFPNSMLTQCSDQQLRGLFELGMELPIEYAGAIYFLASPCK